MRILKIRNNYTHVTISFLGIKIKLRYSNKDNSDALPLLQYDRLKNVPFRGIRRPYGQRKVAILTNQLVDYEDLRPRFGGGERIALSIANLLKEFGFEVHFYQPALKQGSVNYYGFPVYTLPMIPEAYGEFQYGICRKFTEMTQDYDHILHNLIEYSSGEMREDALTICHGIWFDHNNYPHSLFRTRLWYQELYRAFAHPKGVISVDTNVISYVRCMWPELANKMTFIPNFYDRTEYKPDFNKRNPDKLTILFPRRSTINRGSHIFGEIVDRIHHNVRIIWLGEGDKEGTEEIKKVCKQDPRVEFHVAPFEEMSIWYQIADIAVIPTIACEGTSLSCIEALASGCAVISTNVGGLSDIIHISNTGLLVDPTPESISDAINLLIENPEMRIKIENDGIKCAEAFEMENWKKRWVKVLYKHDWINKDQFNNWTNRKTDMVTL